MCACDGENARDLADGDTRSARASRSSAFGGTRRASESWFRRASRVCAGRARLHARRKTSRPRRQPTVRSESRTRKVEVSHARRLWVFTHMRGAEKTTSAPSFEKLALCRLFAALLASSHPCRCLLLVLELGELERHSGIFLRKHSLVLLGNAGERVVAHTCSQS